jgi:hypothetical protein
MLRSVPQCEECELWAKSVHYNASELARIAHISPRHFRRQFHAKKGARIWLTKWRIVCFACERQLQLCVFASLRLCVDFPGSPV